jgi:hypothetical protein
MTSFFISFFTGFGAFFRSRYNLGLEILALRQQLGVLKRKNPRPRLQIQDRVFWILLRRLWPAWSNALVIVKPETTAGMKKAEKRIARNLKTPLTFVHFGSARMLRLNPVSDQPWIQKVSAHGPNTRVGSSLVMPEAARKNKNNISCSAIASLM